MAANKKKYASEFSAAARFMSTVHDDLLLEILIRLPRMGHAMTVCKSWYSLIISDHPSTFLRHTLHHQHRRQSGDPDPSYTPPCTLLFGYRPTIPCIQVLSEKAKILNAALSRQSPQRNLLGFVSNLISEAIKASFNDLLLIDLDGQYCVYNPVTREQRLLPNPPAANDPAGAKSMLVGSEDSKGIFRFKVVRFLFPRVNTVQIFSSETGQWNEPELNLYPSSRWMVAAGGALHWLHKSSGIVVYDPFRPASDPSSCRMVGYPFELDKFNLNTTIRIGAVRGRLRLLDTLFEENDVRLRIWELKNGNDDDDDDEWRLVQQVWVETGDFLSVVAFHPEDEDVIFVSNCSEIFRCELKSNRVHKVGEVSADESWRVNYPFYYFKDWSLVHHWF